MNLTEYLNESIEHLLHNALRASLKNPAESAFLLRFGAAQKKFATKRRVMEQNGRHIPPFLIASIASQCNLRCAGCYARAGQACGDHADRGELSAEEWDRVFSEAEELGVSFILLAGGEPVMRRDVLEKACGHAGILFPVFTNGTLLEDRLEFFSKHRNLMPILSLEGGAELTDRRRGSGTYEKLNRAMEGMNQRGIFFGTSITVTKDNLAEVTGDAFSGEMCRKGCKVFFYVEYVPVDPASEGIAPGERERELLAGRLDRLKNRYLDAIFLSFPGDEKELGGCLAAGRGFFHINARGGAEPCPFSPYSDVSVKTGGLQRALESVLFRRIQESGLEAEEHTGGCALFRKKEEVEKLLEQSDCESVI